MRTTLTTLTLAVLLLGGVPAYAQSNRGPADSDIDIRQNILPFLQTSEVQNSTDTPVTAPPPPAPTPEPEPAPVVQPRPDLTPVTPIISTPTPTSSNPTRAYSSTTPLLNTSSSGDGGVYRGSTGLTLAQVQTLLVLSILCCGMGALLAEQTTLRRLGRAIRIIIDPAPVRSSAA